MQTTERIAFYRQLVTELPEVKTGKAGVKFNTRGRLCTLAPWASGAAPPSGSLPLTKATSHPPAELTLPKHFLTFPQGLVFHVRTWLTFCVYLSLISLLLPSTGLTMPSNSSGFLLSHLEISSMSATLGLRGICSLIS